jgi:hypothetical protein
VLAGRRERVLEHRVAAGEPLVEVAALDQQVRVHVGDRGLAVQPLVGQQIGMQDGCVGLHRRQRIEHRGQLLVLHVDEGERLLGRLGVDGRHGGHALADEADAVARHDRLVLQAAPHEGGRVVRAGQDDSHAPHPRGAAGVDAHDARVRQRAAKALRPQRTWQGEIRRVAGGTRDLRHPVLANDRPPDHRQLHIVSSSRRGRGTRTGAAFAGPRAPLIIWGAAGGSKTRGVCVTAGEVG